MARKRNTFDSSGGVREAQKRIASAAQDNSTELDLSMLRLTTDELRDLIPEIGQITGLQILILEINQLTTLPAEIGSLSALRGLLLSGNQLTELPPEIGQLTALQKLYLVA